MQYLLREAARLGVEIVWGTISTGERVRYYPATASNCGRIVVADYLTPADAYSAIAIGLAHARLGHTATTVDVEAAHREAAMMLLQRIRDVADASEARAESELSPSIGEQISNMTSPVETFRRRVSRFGVLAGTTA